MLEPATIATVFAAYLLAGTVKGVIGLGLPTVSLGILTLIIDLPTAIALILVPAFATNIWQGLVGGHARAVVGRLWLFLAIVTLLAPLGTAAFGLVDAAVLTAFLGLLLMTYAFISLAGIAFTLTSRPPVWIEAAVAGVTGLITGMTGAAVVPGVMYLQALGMPRDMFIQALGILFALTTLALGVGLERNDILTVELAILSAGALAPAVLGMIMGQRIRRRLSETMFRRVFFTAILLLGAYLALQSLGRIM